MMIDQGGIINAMLSSAVYSACKENYVYNKIMRHMIYKKQW